MGLGLVHEDGISKLQAQMLVLVLEVVLNVLLGVLFQRLAPMEIASALSARHRDLGITIIIDNPDCIPIGMSTINHESLELYFIFLIAILYFTILIAVFLFYFLYCEFPSPGMFTESLFTRVQFCLHLLVHTSILTSILMTRTLCSQSCRLRGFHFLI